MCSILHIIAQVLVATAGCSANARQWLIDSAAVPEDALLTICSVSVKTINMGLPPLFECAGIWPSLSVTFGWWGSTVVLGAGGKATFLGCVCIQKCFWWSLHARIPKCIRACTLTTRLYYWPVYSGHFPPHPSFRREWYQTFFRAKRICSTPESQKEEESNVKRILQNNG